MKYSWTMAKPIRDNYSDPLFPVFHTIFSSFHSFSVFLFSAYMVVSNTAHILCLIIMCHNFVSHVQHWPMAVISRAVNMTAKPSHLCISEFLTKYQWFFRIFVDYRFKSRVWLKLITIVIIIKYWNAWPSGEDTVRNIQFSTDISQRRGKLFLAKSPSTEPTYTWLLLNLWFVIIIFKW